MAGNQAPDSWFEGMGLHPFPLKSPEHTLGKYQGTLDKLKAGVRRGFTVAQVGNYYSTAELLLSRSGDIASSIPLKSGGLLRITRMNFEDDQAIGVAFDPQQANRPAFTAFFESKLSGALPGSVFGLSCSVSVGEYGTEDYREFRTTDQEFLDQSMKEIRDDLAIVSDRLDEALVSRIFNNP